MQSARKQYIIVQCFKLFISLKFNYLNPIEACHTNANNKKKTGIIGSTSTIGLKTTYASGKRDNNKVSINNSISLKFFKSN